LLQITDSLLESLLVTASSYMARVVDTEVGDDLRAPMAVLIEGAKSVGKTETASQQAKTRVLLDVDQEARAAAALDPTLLLGGDKPLLIDEWQEFPAIWNHIRRAVDAHEGPFILTGSAVPADDATRHTGAGRFSRVRMRPMTLFEQGRSSGRVSLASLLDGEPISTKAVELPISELTEVICIGGWPTLVGKSGSVALRTLGSYLDSIARTDIRRVDGISRDPQKVWSVLRALARNVGTEASIATISRDAGGVDGPVDEDTARAYLAALERLMIVENQPSWAPRLRSRARLRSAPKRHFCDPSLATAALGVTPAGLVRELEYLGFLFESLVVRDLRVYAQHSGASVRHYRDNIGEVDVIIEDGSRWAAIEVKLGVSHVEAAATNLAKALERIDTAQCGEPAFRGIVLPTRFGYTRDDGIHVIPVQALGP
jgi:uncharacterized protein